MAWKKYSDMSPEEKKESWSKFSKSAALKKKMDERRVSDIKKHDCKKSNCGSVCTYGDY